MKRELLAGMFVLERWRPFLLFRKFYWGMDNKALTYLNNSSNRMVLDWLGFFQKYDFETRFKRGVLNVLPHELSHMYSMLELDHGLKKPGLGCRQQNPSSFYFWDSYLRITIQKSIHESHNFPNDPIIKSRNLLAN